MSAFGGKADVSYFLHFAVWPCRFPLSETPEFREGSVADFLQKALFVK